MLPTTVGELKDERNKENGKASCLIINLLWRLSVQIGISRHMLPTFKIIIILGASVTAVYHFFDIFYEIPHSRGLRRIDHFCCLHGILHLYTLLK